MATVHRSKVMATRLPLILGHRVRGRDLPRFGQRKKGCGRRNVAARERLLAFFFFFFLVWFSFFLRNKVGIGNFH